MEQEILRIAVGYPKVAAVLLLIGGSRAILKSGYMFLKQVADWTPTTYDNEILAKFAGTRTYKVLSGLLDLVASVKLPQAKP